MWPKPNPESNTAIRLYATVSKSERTCQGELSRRIEAIELSDFAFQVP